MTKEEVLATKAGRSLDRLVAIQVMGEPMPDFTPENAFDLQLAGSPVKSPQGNWLCLCEYAKGDIPTWRPLPCSTDISAAWQVQDKMFELGYAMSLLHLSSELYSEYWYCDFRLKNSNKPPEYKWADHQMTAPVAICKSALLNRIEGGR